MSSSTAPNRYEQMFARLAEAKQGAFIPFCVIGDPTPAASAANIDALIEGGADALELGIPFSDPVADGPTIQAADLRALEAGTTPDQALEVISGVRDKHPSIPIGLLVYANLVETRGRDVFYRRCNEVGVDSVLIADVPTIEAQPFSEAAIASGVAPVLIASPNISEVALKELARLSRGYTYVVTRRGVTGAEIAPDARRESAPAREQDESDTSWRDHDDIVKRLTEVDAPPPVFGFGISTPAHVRSALLSGARGAISGSAVVRHIAENLDDTNARHRALASFTESMKAATSL